MDEENIDKRIDITIYSGFKMVFKEIATLPITITYGNNVVNLTAL